MTNKITYNIVGGALRNSECGCVTKEGVTYVIKELKSKWKLTGKVGGVDVVLEFPKAENDTIETFREYLKSQGFTVE